MAHKHTRRRIRPRSRNHKTLVDRSLYDRSLLSKPGIASDAEPPNISTSGIYSTTTDSLFVDPDQMVKATNRSQNLHTYWQPRTTWQLEEAAKLECERIKLFGGVPGDDVGLCYRMLEYFGGLDFIDT
jgi:ABC-type Fe3+-citrate transport system substrate-binding protein